MRIVLIELGYGRFYEPGTERFDSLLNLITSRTSFVEEVLEFRTSLPYTIFMERKFLIPILQNSPSALMEGYIIHVQKGHYLVIQME